jgi:phage recombination protein Bet
MNTEPNKTEIVKPPQKETPASALSLMAQRLNVDPTKLLETLKKTVFKEASNEELMALVVVANQYGLNPFTKEIYGFKGRGGGIVPVVGVDGWSRLMNSASNFDGIEFEWETSEAGKPVSCTAIIWLKNRSRPVKVTEFYAECYRDSEPWKLMPFRMLRHKALIQACRVGFGFSGIYDEDEAEAQAVDVRINNAKPVSNEFDMPALTSLPDYRRKKSYTTMVNSFRKDGWQKVEVPISGVGFEKGETLGAIESRNPDTLKVLSETFEPELVNGDPEIKQLVFRAALDAVLPLQTA